MASCVFCYFAGLYMIAAKAGITRLISQYGLHRTFDEWPADFPSFGLVSAFLIAYTIAFFIITIWIYKAMQRHAIETDKLQGETSIIHNYAEELSLTVSLHNRLVRDMVISDKNQKQRQKLQLLQKQIAALAPSVFKDVTAESCIQRIVSEIGDAVNSIKNAPKENIPTLTDTLTNLIEDDLIEVKKLRTNSISIK